jgi:hypothetical protein
VSGTKKRGRQDLRERKRGRGEGDEEEKETIGKETRKKERPWEKELWSFSYFFVYKEKMLC